MTAKPEAGRTLARLHHSSESDRGDRFWLERHTCQDYRLEGYNSYSTCSRLDDRRPGKARKLDSGPCGETTHPANFDFFDTAKTSGSGVGTARNPSSPRRYQNSS